MRSKWPREMAIQEKSAREELISLVWQIRKISDPKAEQKCFIWSKAKIVNARDEGLELLRKPVYCVLSPVIMQYYA